VEVHAVVKENYLPSNHKALNMSHSVHEKRLLPSYIIILPKLGGSRSSGQPIKISHSCESHTDFDYKNMKSVASTLFKGATKMPHATSLSPN
jgi:hypothetical protein